MTLLRDQLTFTSGAPDDLQLAWELSILRRIYSHAYSSKLIALCCTVLSLESYPRSFRGACAHAPRGAGIEDIWN